MRAAHEGRLQHARLMQIVNEAPLPAQERHIFETRVPFADLPVIRHDSSLRDCGTFTKR
jgi:hypothetical protein